MNDPPYRLLAIYHHVAPCYPFLVVVIRPRDVEYPLQVVSALSWHLYS